MTRLRPGMVVQAVSDERQAGLIVAERLQQPGNVPLFDVEWVGSGDAQNQTSVDFIRHAPEHVLAGDVFGKLEVLEVDMTAEVMKVRVGEHRLLEWIDVRLARLPASWATRAAQVRKKYIEDDRQKLDWFKPGQIVKGDGALARPATVVKQDNASTVQVITSNGLADVPFSALQLHSLSVQDLQLKEAQKRENLLANFKGEVREKAMEAATEHGWCEEVKTILQELGIKIPVNKVRAVLHLTVEVEAVMMGGSGMNRLDLEHSNNREWWGNTLKFEDDGSELSVKDDDDVDEGSVEVRLISSRVEEVHDESYLEGEQ